MHRKAEPPASCWRGVLSLLYLVGHRPGGDATDFAEALGLNSFDFSKSCRFGQLTGLGLEVRVTSTPPPGFGDCRSGVNLPKNEWTEGHSPASLQIDDGGNTSHAVTHE